MTTISTGNRKVALWLGVLQAFVGLGALGGGIGLIAQPDGSNLGISLYWLRQTPFTDYLVPGIILFVVNGLGSLAGAALSFVRYRYAGEIAVLLGAFLMGWIAAQVWWMGLHWLHVLYFGLGLAELILGLSLRKTIIAD